MNEIEVTHFGPFVTYKPEWTKQARKLTGRAGIKVYFDDEFDYVSVVENGHEMYSVTRWDERGRDKLLKHTTKLKYGKYHGWYSDHLDMVAGQARDKQRQEDDWNRETFDDIQKYGVREKKHLPLS